MKDDNQRRASDPLILEMHGDIKVLLSKLDNHSDWIDKHDASDTKNFKEINEQIVAAKATIKTVGVIGGMVLAFIEMLHNVIPWIRGK